MYCTNLLFDLLGMNRMFTGTRNDFISTHDVMVMYSCDD